MRGGKRLLEKEEKFMETFKANVKSENDHQYLCLITDVGEYMIPLTDNDTQVVKDVFNKLIVRLKTSVFQFEMEGVGNDLFSQVAMEYIKQLNSELANVRKDLEHHKLLIEDEGQASVKAAA